MEKLQSLKKRVAELYQTRQPGRSAWTDWLFEEHVPYVAAKAREVAAVYGGNPDLAEAAGWLHDIADVKMDRHNDNHEQESLAMARQVMQECGYSDEEVSLVVDDAIRLHSCYDGIRPESAEGQALATADALAHLQTDFYIYATRALAGDMSLAEMKAWALKKIERDFTHKICYDAVREQARPDYEIIKNLFSRAPVQSQA
jgi:putative nucleotidyltransferase with HDIG domain